MNRISNLIIKCFSCFDEMIDEMKRFFSSHSFIITFISLIVCTRVCGVCRFHFITFLEQRLLEKTVMV